MSESIRLFPQGFYAFRSHFRDRQPIVMLPQTENEALCVMLPEPDLAEIRTTWIKPSQGKAASQASPDAELWLELVG